MADWGHWARISSRAEIGPFCGPWLLRTWRRHLCPQLCCSWSILLTRSLLNFADIFVCQHCSQFMSFSSAHATELSVLRRIFGFPGSSNVMINTWMIRKMDRMLSHWTDIGRCRWRVNWQNFWAWKRKLKDFRDQHAKKKVLETSSGKVVASNCLQRCKI